MSYSVKKYINEKGVKMMNIWDSTNKSWIFDYLDPKYKISETNLRIQKKKIFEITDKKGDKPYLYDITNKCVFELGIDGIKFKKAVYNENDFGDSKFSVYRSVDNDLYVVFPDGNYFKLPDNKHVLSWGGLSGNYIFICYNTNKLQDNYLGSECGHTVTYYKIFDKNSGKELFQDYYIEEIMFNSSFSKMLAFSDGHDTHFIKDDKIVNTFKGYVYSDDRLNSGKRHEYYILTTEQDNEKQKNHIREISHKLIVDKNGKIIREVDALFIEDIASMTVGRVFDEYYRKYENGSSHYITPVSKKYGKNFQTDWFTYYGENDYIRIENYKGESLLKFNDATSARIHINKQGDMFFICIRNGLIYIYDENWNCLSDKWVIYSKYTVKNGCYYKEETDSIDRAVKFDYETGRFMFGCAHVKKNDGSYNTGSDWILMSSRYDNKRNEIPEYIF